MPLQLLLDVNTDIPVIFAMAVSTYDLFGISVGLVAVYDEVILFVPIFREPDNVPPVTDKNFEFAVDEVSYADNVDVKVVDETNDDKLVIDAYILDADVMDRNFEFDVDDVS